MTRSSSQPELVGWFWQLASETTVKDMDRVQSMYAFMCMIPPTCPATVCQTFMINCLKHITLSLNCNLRTSCSPYSNAKILGWPLCTDECSFDCAELAFYICSHQKTSDNVYPKSFNAIYFLMAKSSLYSVEFHKFRPWSHCDASEEYRKSSYHSMFRCIVIGTFYHIFPLWRFEKQFDWDSKCESLSSKW